MKFSVSSKSLYNIASAAGKIISSKNTLQILNNFLFILADGGHRPAYALLVAAPYVVRYDHVGSDGYAEKQVYHHGDDHAVRPHGSKRLVTAPSANYHHIDSVE